jgi:hypothetical protein
MLTSIVRTVVPLIVGWLLSIPVVAGLGLSDEQLAGFVTAIVATIYYITARFAERRWPQLGVLLGSAKQPAYARHSAVAGGTGRPPGDSADIDAGFGRV